MIISTAWILGGPSQSALLAERVVAVCVKRAAGEVWMIQVIAVGVSRVAILPKVGSGLRNPRFPCRLKI